MVVTVYVLIDSRDNGVRYVGITGNMSERFRSHLQCDGSNLAKDRWIQELRDNQLELIMRPLEHADSTQTAKEREQYWIQHYFSLGACLFNREVLDSPENNAVSRDTKDREKYIYLTIGIPRDSSTHKALLADAEEHNTKQLPTIVSVRLGDYYRMRQQAITVIPYEQAKSTESNEGPSVEALSNAAEADDAWPDD